MQGRAKLGLAPKNARTKTQSQKKTSLPSKHVNTSHSFDTYYVSRSVYPNRRFHTIIRQPLHYCQPLLATAGANRSHFGPGHYELPYHHRSACRGTNRFRVDWI